MILLQFIFQENVVKLLAEVVLLVVSFSKSLDTNINRGFVIHAIMWNYPKLERTDQEAQL